MPNFDWVEDARNGRVFGTYFLPEDILSDEYCPDILHLKDVSIWHRRKHTGLDVTHNHIQRPLLPTDFFGILTIEKSYWVKRNAKAQLSALIEQKHEQKTIGEPPIDLDKLYLEDETIDIRLKCSMSDKVMQPQCYSSDEYPEELLFHSLDSDGERTRTWIISSMDPLTFKDSRNYLHRYTVLALLKELAFPPDPNNPKSVALPPPKVPLEQRTPRWFVKQYCTRYNLSTIHQQSRFQFLSSKDDKDVELSDSEGETLTTTLKRTKTPRFPRPISKAEVRAQFASCAEWILAEQCLKRSDRREVNISAWDTFIKTVVRPGRRATQGTWGMPLEDMAVPEHPNANLEDDQREVYLGDYCLLDAALIRRKLVKSAREPPVLQERTHVTRPMRGLPRRTKASTSTSTPIEILDETLTQRSPSPFRGPTRRRHSLSTVPPASHSPEPNVDVDSMREPPPLLRPRYDSDFSNSDDSDAGQQSDDSDIDDIDPGLILPIPRSCFFDYQTLPGSYTWRCDVKGCSWSLNKLRLYQDEEDNDGAFALLDRAEKEVRISNKFEDVIEDHQIGHFIKWGIGMRWEGEKAMFYWKRPREHKPYPHARNKYGAKTERLPEEFKELRLT